MASGDLALDGRRSLRNQFLCLYIGSLLMVFWVGTMGGTVWTNRQFEAALGWQWLLIAKVLVVFAIYFVLGILGQRGRIAWTWCAAFLLLQGLCMWLPGILHAYLFSRPYEWGVLGMGRMCVVFVVATITPVLIGRLGYILDWSRFSPISRDKC